MHVPHRLPDDEYLPLVGKEMPKGIVYWLVFLLAFFTFGLLIHGLVSGLNGWRPKQET